MISTFFALGIFCLLSGRVGLGQTPSAASQKPEMPEVVDHEAQPSLRIRAERNLVIVRVVVRDAKGHTVANLHKEDFRLFDNRKPQEISGFEVVTGGSKAPASPPPSPQPAKPEETAEAPAAPAPAVAQRFVGLFFDDLHMSVEEVMRSRQAASRYLSRAIRPQDRVAIFTSSHQGQVDFTDDHAKLEEAVRRITPSSDALLSLAACPEITPYQAYQIDQLRVRGDGPDDAAGIAVREACLCDQLRVTDVGSPAIGAPGPGGKNLGGACDEFQELKRVQEEAAGIWSMTDRRSQDSLEAIEGAVRQLGVLPGQRSLVLVSSGFLTLTRGSDVDVIIDRALRQEVVISAIDAAGLYAYEAPPMFQLSGRLKTDKDKFVRTALTMSRDVLANLADGTGGIFFHNSNDYDEGFRETAAVPETYYVLTFSPQNLMLDGKYHPLKVTLNVHEPWSVLARRGYFAPQKEQQAGLGENAIIKQEVFSQDELHGLPVEVGTQFFRINESTARLSVLTHVDVRPLPFRKEGDRNLDNLTFVTVVFDRDGKYVDSRDKSVEFHLRDASLKKLAESGITSRASFDLRSGTYLVRLVVRDTEGGLMTALNRTVEIPY